MSRNLEKRLRDLEIKRIPEELKINTNISDAEWKRSMAAFAASISGSSGIPLPEAEKWITEGMPGL